MQYCSLQHHTLLSPVISTTWYHFHFGSASSFLLELFLCSSPVAYWAPTNLGNSSFSILSFCLFILFMGFSRQEYWSGLPFPSPVNHVFSEFSTMSILLGWPSMAWLIASWSYTRLWSICSFWLAFCDCGFRSGGCKIVVLASSLCPLMDEMRIRGFSHLQNFSIACSRTVEYNDQETHGPVHKAVVLPDSQRGISKCWLQFC